MPRWPGWKPPPPQPVEVPDSMSSRAEAFQSVADPHGMSGRCEVSQSAADQINISDRTEAFRSVADRYRSLLSRLERAGGSNVTVIAVTKAFGPWAVDAAAACGITHIGENYAQECVAKLAEVVTEPRPQVHFVGRLQRNKVRMLVDWVDVWQTVDRKELAREIGQRAPGAMVMIQVNIAARQSQGGCAPDQTEAMVSAAADAGLRVLGLMAIGDPGPSTVTRAGFRTLRRLADSLGLQHCSMGMSNDLETAVAEGATMVRVGRCLFGERR